MTKYRLALVLLILVGGILCERGSGWSAMAQSAGLPGPSVNSSLPAPLVSSGNGKIAQPSPPSLPANSADDSYRLGTGDQLKITVYGEDDLSGEFTVDGSGQVQLPLVGQIQAANLTVHQFIEIVQETLGAKYLRNPRVSVQIENYRPFFIMGEVNKPGAYPYEGGLSVLGAVALAGGYTYRANDSEIYLRHKGETDEKKMLANSSTLIAPGDIIRIPERMF